MVASIEDVARRAGVSIATVSRALRGLPDVAAATRDRVLAAATELNYVASPFAARLASGRTATVGLVVPFVNRWFFAEVIATVETALRHAGFDLLLYNLGDADGRTPVLRRHADAQAGRRRAGRQPRPRRRGVRRARPSSAARSGCSACEREGFLSAPHRRRRLRPHRGRPPGRRSATAGSA